MINKNSIGIAYSTPWNVPLKILICALPFILGSSTIRKTLQSGHIKKADQ
jgi:hypothetical protein